MLEHFLNKKVGEAGAEIGLMLFALLFALVVLASQALTWRACYRRAIFSLIVKEAGISEADSAQLSSLKAAVIKARPYVAGDGSLATNVGLSGEGRWEAK